MLRAPCATGACCSAPPYFLSFRYVVSDSLCSLTENAHLPSTALEPYTADSDLSLSVMPLAGEEILPEGTFLYLGRRYNCSEPTERDDDEPEQLLGGGWGRRGRGGEARATAQSSAELGGGAAQQRVATVGGKAWRQPETWPGP